MCEKEVAGDEANWFVRSKWQKKNTEIMFLTKRKKGSGGEEMVN